MGSKKYRDAMRDIYKNCKTEPDELDDDERECDKEGHDFEHIDTKNQIARCRKCGVKTKYRYEMSESDLIKIGMSWWQ